MNSNEDPAAKLTRKQRERFEASVHALAIIALAREVYTDDERRRLLAECAAFIDAHEAAVSTAEEDKLPGTAPREEIEAQAIRVVGRVRAASEACDAFNKVHPLIIYMHSYTVTLTRSFYD